MALSFGKIAGTALAVSVAYAWNDTAKTIINKRLRPSGESAGIDMIIYALLVTLVVLIIILITNKTATVAKKFMSSDARASPEQS